MTEASTMFNEFLAQRQRDNQSQYDSMVSDNDRRLRQLLRGQEQHLEILNSAYNLYIDTGIVEKISLYSTEEDFFIELAAELKRPKPLFVEKLGRQVWRFVLPARGSLKDLAGPLLFDAKKLDSLPKSDHDLYWYENNPHNPPAPIAVLSNSKNHHFLITGKDQYEFWRDNLPKSQRIREILRLDRRP